jgi:ubiquinone/menaquinone biosynthesis C-methylase UbiE
LAEDKVRAFYEKEAAVYAETRFASSQGIYCDAVQRSTVLELIEKCEGKCILEIGSGTGRFTKELVERGAYVVCADLSRKMHEQSRLLLSDASVEYTVMSGSRFGFVNNVFDVCLAVNMMSHIRNDSEIFAEVSRVLKRHGLFVANFANLSGIYLPIGGLVNLFGRSLQAPVYSRWYSLGRLIGSLRRSGLCPVRVLGHIVFPKKHCPSILFRFLKNFDLRMLDSGLSILLGDLFVKSQKV